MFPLRVKRKWEYLRRCVIGGRSHCPNMTVENRHSMDTDPAELIGDPFLPPIHLRRRISHHIMGWYRWGTEFSCYLKMYCGLNKRSHVLEIGCNVGRNAYPLRSDIGPCGSYNGFDIDAEGIAYLQELYAPGYPQFHFTHADLHNTHYNPDGIEAPEHFRFPYDDDSFDIAFAASIFTHMLPNTTAHYFNETARTLKPGGVFLCTFFVRDYYQGKGTNTFGDFEHDCPGFEQSCSVVSLENPELLTAYSLDAIAKFARDAGFEKACTHLYGRWSGKFNNPFNDQEILVFRHGRIGT